MHALPKDFLWGNSTSSMQTEGADQEDGKGKSVYSDRPATLTRVTGKSPSTNITAIPKTSR